MLLLQVGGVTRDVCAETGPWLGIGPNVSRKKRVQITQIQRSQQSSPEFVESKKANIKYHFPSETKILLKFVTKFLKLEKSLLQHHKFL